VGRFCLLLIALLLASPVFAAWQVAESPHFRVHARTSAEALRADAAELEDFHRLLQLVTGRDWPKDAPKLDIYLLERREQLRILEPDVSPYAAGFYRPSDTAILAVAVRSRGATAEYMPARQILLHEYAHHFMHQVAPGAFPAWYVEGFAEYLMTATFTPERVEFGGFNKGRAYTLMLGTWIPLERLLARSGRLDPNAFYAQSWLLTHYLSRTPGMPEKLRAYLKRVGDGEDPVAAFRAEISDDLPRFQSTLKRYLDGRDMTYSRMTRAAPTAADIRLTSLPPSSEAMLLPLVSLTLPQKAETDRANFERLRDAAARFPGDPWAERALAIGEAIAGDRALGAARLDRLLEANPDDPELLRWRAMLYRPDRPDADPADISAARRLLVRAFKAAPNDWRVLWAHARTYLGRPGPLPKTVLDVLVRANDLAPQVPGLAAATGLALAEAGEHVHARQVLAGVLYNPHLPDRAPEADALMDALAAGDGARVSAALASARAAFRTVRRSPGPPGEPEPTGAEQPAAPLGNAPAQGSDSKRDQEGERLSAS
jgi:hypothetical protein